MAEEKAPQAGLTATRFKPGQSGNPGGRPKSLRAFRARCRTLSRKLLSEIEKRMSDPDVPLGDVVRAYEAVSDRGGFLKADVQAGVEAEAMRLIVAAMAVKTLSKEQRHALLTGLARELAEALPDAG